MADAYVRILPDGQGKKLQTYENTVGSDSVHAEAVTIVGSDGEPILISGDKLRVSTTPYPYDIARGEVAGVSPLHKIGINAVVQNLIETVWQDGGVYVFPSSDMQMELVSTSANDDVAGTGIQKVTIYYLDDTYAAQTEEVELDGLNVVTTTATNILRVNALRASQVGTGLKAAGIISLRHLADTPVYASIRAGETQELSLIYTVPLGKTLYITDLMLSGGSVASGHASRFFLRSTYDTFSDSVVSWFTTIIDLIIQDAALHVPLASPMKIPATTDIMLNVVSDDAAANVTSEGTLRGWIE